MEKLLTIIMPVYNQPDLILRALESIPKRDDIEILIIDDSDDGTTEIIERWAEGNPSVRLVHHEERKGIGYAKNLGYTLATGKYINQLDADDYLYTEEYEKVMAQLDGTDIVYQSLRVNDGRIFEVTKESQRMLCAGTARFFRREFLGDTRCDEVFIGEDWNLNERIQAKPHTDKFTRIVGYHYNFPREGSLYDLQIRGWTHP